MIGITKTSVTIVPQPRGSAVLTMNHPGAPPHVSVVLTDEIIDYLMLNLPKHYSALRQPCGPTGPH